MRAGLRCALAGLLAAGCASSRKKTEPPGPRVRDVEVEGAEHLEEDELVEYLNLRPSPVLPIGSRTYYLPGLEALDRRRIQRVYEAHGHYDAKVERLEVRVVRPDKKVRRQRADVFIEVDEGEGTTVRRVELTWTDPVNPAINREETFLACPLKAGQLFTVPAIEDAARSIESFLADKGYAFAEVTEFAEVDRGEHLADVELVIEPGPRKRVTKIELEGLDRVPKDLVRRETEFVLDARYSPGLLRDLERNVYAMGVFTAVTVSLGPRTEDESLTLQVRVQEQKLQRIKLGVGLGIDPARWDQHFIARYNHDNLFGRLYGFSARAKVGYAELPALYDPQQHGPITRVDLELKKKGLLEPKLVWTEAPQFDLGLWDGYQYYSAANRIGVSRFFTRFFELSLSYNNRFTDFFNVSPTLDQNRTILGLDFRDPYVLAYAELMPVVHLTDDLLRPNNGVRLSAKYDLASTYLGGQFDYHQIEPELRGYYRPHDRVQLAARSWVAMIFPYGKNPGAPIDRKLYLGGTGDVRGWGIRRLSPRIALCEDDGSNCSEVPIGGKSLVQGTFELRVRTWKDLWFAGFADAGDVREGIAEFDLRGLMYSVGGGARYDSDIGVFRLDLGVRLNDDPRFPEPRRWAVHFAVGQPF